MVSESTVSLISVNLPPLRKSDSFLSISREACPRPVLEGLLCRRGRLLYRRGVYCRHGVRMILPAFLVETLTLYVIVFFQCRRRVSEVWLT